MSVMETPTVSFLKRKTAADVNDPKSFAEYAQQKLGIPYPTGKSIAILKKALREFFEHYPQADYNTMCRVVEWAKTKKKRYAQVYQLVYAFRYAYQDGYLPELDPGRELTDSDLEAAIEAVLVDEHDLEWRRRLIVADGLEARRHVYEQWREAH